MSDWISVEERLPKVGERIIWWDRECEEPFVSEYEADDLKGGWPDPKVVSHWMYFAPPKESNDG